MLSRLFQVLVLIFLMPSLLFSQVNDPHGEEQLEKTKEQAQEKKSTQDLIDLKLISENSSFQEGKPFWVVIKGTVATEWKTYWLNPGESGKPTQIEWNLPEGFTVTDMLWSYPEKFAQEGMTTFGYHNTFYILAQITPPDSWKMEVEFKAKINWMVCKDSCIPGETLVSVRLPVSQETPKKNVSAEDTFAAARLNIPGKDKAVLAESHEKGVSLLLPKSYENFTEAYFFTETAFEDMTVLHQELVSDSAGHHLVLSSETNNDNIQSTLKGVLVIKTEKEGLPATTTALQINLGEPSTRNTLIETEAESMNLGLALVLAFIGGLILNLMPCVLPVITLKIMSFVKLAGQNRTATLKHGFAFFIGAMIAFWVLAGILLVFRSYGEAVGWGFQLQSPLFVALLALVLLIFGLSLFGVFEMGTSISSLAGKAQMRSSGLMGSLFSGVLATAVATPCTGPFLGTTVGFAVTLPAAGAMLIFTAMGAGMGFPYLLLSSFPKLLRFLPKPGAWMETFKELMGFIMIATVLWLVWVFAAQTSIDALMMLFGAFFAASIASWIHGRWGSPAKKLATRFVSWTFSLLFLLSGVWTVVVASSFEEQGVSSPNASLTQGIVAQEWIPFSAEKIEELRKNGTPVFVDFTAKWCLICQANKLVLRSEEVTRLFKEQGVVRMTADWTKNDPAITKELRKYGRNGVPLYLLYTADTTVQAQVLPQLITLDVMRSTLANLKTVENVAGK